MAGPEIVKLKRILREKALPPGANITLEQRRGGMEKIAFKAADDIKSEKVTVAGCAAEWVRAPEVQPGRAILYLHGGGYVMGSPNTHRSLAGEISRAAQAAVLLVDYRLAPEHPFPAAVEDGVASYRWLLEQGFAPRSLAIAGDSAGGGLVAAMLVSARDQQLPMPAAAVCISPWSDMTCSNESYKTRAEADPMVGSGGIGDMARLYLQGTDPKNPLASPNFASLRSLPPLLIHVGRDEVLLDDSIKLDQKAKAEGVDSTLEVWEDMIHVWHAFHPMLPEGKQAITRVGEFLREKWAAV
ncbi:MAG TPA: alpha/beta hydrolase [Candidatus Binatia bacterium]|jgi:acetyl esterase/lipase|nr:alpha/beta hydrolase [Candidatus Binatia bacterium]